MKQGALIFDEQTDRYDIRFDLSEYYGGLHCRECFGVFTGGRWKPTRIEYGDSWYLVGVRAADLTWALIPYEAMYQDGVCRLTARTFSKCIEFADISYQLAQADTKTAISENLCDLYNYLDTSIHVQFSFVNRKTDPKQYAKCCWNN